MMDTALKERLIGAAVLMVLVVALVPALLSGPRPASPAVEPGSEQAAQTEVKVVEIDLSGPRGGSDASQPVAEVDDPATTATAAVSQDMPVTSPTLDAPRGPEAPPEGVPGPQAGSPAPVPEGAQQAPGSAWAVQVAALSNREAAESLAADLRGRGYSAFVLEYRAEGRVFFRVRIGPEPRRERAEALAGRLASEGLKPSVVAHP